MGGGPDSALGERAHANHVAFHALTATRADGGALARIGGVLACALPHPFPFLNSVIAEGEAADPAAALDGARAFFDERGRDGWSLFTRGSGEDAGLEEAAAEMGLEIVNPRYPEMVRTEPLELPELDRCVELREIDGAGEVESYWRLCGDAYASLRFPAELFDVFAPHLLDPPACGCLAWLDGAPIGGAMVAPLEGVGFVGWVATAPAARGRGVGATVTAWVTNRAFSAGATLASLQASPMGLSVYERLGYRHLFDYRVWRYAADAGPQASDAGQISR